MVSKNGALSFDVNAYTSSNITTNINFWTQDRQTARLEFKLTKDGVPLPLAAVTGKLVLVMSDGSRFIRDVTITDRLESRAEYILSDQEIKHYGNVQAELNLYYANDQSMSVHQFTFNISKSLIDQDIVPITEYYVDEFEALRAKINELYEESIQTINDLRAKFEDLEKIETKEGAKAKVAEALVEAKKYSDAHVNNKNNPHAVTKSQVGLGDVDNIKQASKVDFDSHVGDKKNHVTGEEKDKWNTSQIWRITDDNGQVRVYINNSNDYHEVLPRYKGFTHFFSDTSAINGPGVALRGFWVCNATGSYGSVVGFDNLNRTWRKTVANGEWSAWERLLTSNDLSSGWNLVTLINGTAQHNSVYPLKFSIRQNTLHLRGSFENIPPSETVIARFAQKPSGKATFGATTVGSYGSAQLSFTEDGSLKFDGLSANDPSKVNRIEINESIPLW
ncbi:phage baseplate upper protein [Bacillus altitudinis]|uniref:phage baseplate upper protein n=1 Tax=Bacillus altitudinis TaxID=293387 RepID=UPI0031F648C6